MADKKIKVLTISDDPRLLSGVAIQTRYFIQGLLDTGKYQFVCIGGAIKHQDYRLAMFTEYGEDWKIIPVDGFGDAKLIRGLIQAEKPDILWFMTDPRYYEWLWMIEDEIRVHCPMVYYHVWDNKPVPLYNKKWYESCDVIATISKLTDECVATVAPNVKRIYLPHTVDDKIFFPLKTEERKVLRKNMFKGKLQEDDFVVLFNNRNAGRKHPQTLLYWWKQLVDKHPDKKLKLVMHCNVVDEFGVDLRVFIEDFKLQDNVVVSFEKVPPSVLNELYNSVDATISISDAEGFGMATLESLFSGTPVIAGETGGLQDQFSNFKHGIYIPVASSMVLGTLQVPYIFTDHYSFTDFEYAIMSALDFNEKNNWKNDQISQECREHCLEKFSMKQYIEKWDEIMKWTYDNLSGLENRKKNYKPWEFSEVI